MGQFITSLLVCTLAGLNIMAQAQSSEGAPAQPSESELAIAAQPLEGALKAVLKKTGLQIVYVTDVVEGKQSAGAPAGLTAAETLEKVLEGTGLTYKYLTERTVTIQKKGDKRADADYASFHLAQAEPADKPAAGDSSKPAARELEEVVVTATKRKENLLKLPQAVTAITSEQLDNLNAQTFEDYFRTVPGLMMNSLGGGGNNRFDFSLRGISDFSQLVPANNPTVSQYYDEIPVTAIGQQIDARLVDVDRIEVLRGPQGTYFGEDSLGGTIRVITKKPILNSFSAAAEARISSTHNGGTNDSESLMVNLPLIQDKLAFRGNYFNAHDTGYVDMVTGACTVPSCSVTAVNATRINPDRADGGRAMLLFQPWERASFLVEAIHSSAVSRGSPVIEPKVGDLQSLVEDTPIVAVNDQSNLYNVTSNIDLGAASLVASSSWGYHTVGQVSPQNSPFGLITNHNDSSFDNSAHELRLVSSKDWSTRWDYVIGAYYSRQDQAAISSNGGVGPGNFQNHRLVKDKAAFGELGYRFTDHLNGRVGLRHQTVDFTNTFSFLPDKIFSGSNTPTTGRVVVNYDFHADAMAYASASKGFRKGGLNNNSLPNGVIIPGIPTTYDADTTQTYEVGAKLSFPSHRANLAAAVFRTDWDNIQVVGLAFAPNTPPPFNQSQFFQNAGQAKVDGLELEGGMELLRGLQAQASLALLDPRFSKDQDLPQDDVVNGNFAPSYCQRGCPARKGDQIPFVSKVTASFTLNYRQALGIGKFTGFMVLSEQYTGSRTTNFSSSWTGPNQSNQPAGTPGCPPFAGPAGCPRTQTGDPDLFYRKLPSSVLTNLQLGVENGAWRTSLFANNLLDKRNVIMATPSQPGFGPTANINGDQVNVDRPRTVGFWIRRNFD